MKKLILLMAAAMTLFVGCKTDKNSTEVPFSEQLIGTWTVTEYLDASTNTYKSVAGTSYANEYAELKADNTFKTSGMSGNYIVKDKTIVCEYSARGNVYIDIIELSGKSIVVDYYSSPDRKTRLKAIKK